MSPRDIPPLLCTPGWILTSLVAFFLGIEDEKKDRKRTEKGGTDIHIKLDNLVQLKQEIPKT